MQSVWWSALASWEWQQMNEAKVALVYRAKPNAGACINMMISYWILCAKCVVLLVQLSIVHVTITSSRISWVRWQVQTLNGTHIQPKLCKKQSPSPPRSSITQQAMISLCPAEDNWNRLRPQPQLIPKQTPPAKQEVDETQTAPNFGQAVART